MATKKLKQEELIQHLNEIQSEVHEQTEKKDLIRRFESQIADTE